MCYTSTIVKVIFNSIYNILTYLPPGIKSSKQTFKYIPEESYTLGLWPAEPQMHQDVS